jgi:hypothetical protein
MELVKDFFNISSLANKTPETYRWKKDVRGGLVEKRLQFIDTGAKNVTG